MELAEPLPPIPTVVVVPEEPDSLAGALLAARHTLILPILAFIAMRKIHLKRIEVLRKLPRVS